MSQDDGPAAGLLHLEQLHWVLQALPSDRADALILRVFSQLSVAEVAQVMGTSETTVKLLVHQAVRDLCERLALFSEAGHEPG
jgi:DNA-directed RNA polymerase specialized sigma24 family protein